MHRSLSQTHIVLSCLSFRTRSNGAASMNPLVLLSVLRELGVLFEAPGAGDVESSPPPPLNAAVSADHVSTQKGVAGYSALSKETQIVVDAYHGPSRNFFPFG